MSKVKIIVLKTILALFLLVIILSASLIIRNYLIVNIIVKNYKLYSDSYNYHQTCISGNLQEDRYVKNYNQAIFENYNNEEFTKMYSDGRSFYHIYNEYKNYKTAELYDEGINLNNNFINFSHVLVLNDNPLRFSLLTLITVTKVNNNKCYRIKGYWFNNDNSLEEIDSIFEYKTGMLVKDNISGLEFSYEFDKVNNEIFIEPDINLYKIKNK